jgi:hypothetical protein
MWELAEEDFFQGAEITPAKDKFVFLHSEEISVVSVETGVIEATWDSGSNCMCHTLKFLSPSLITYSKYGSDIYFSDIQEKKFVGKLKFNRYDTVYDWVCASRGKYFLCAISHEILQIYKTKNLLSGGPVRKQFLQVQPMFLFEIFPNYLIIFDATCFYFASFDSTDEVIWASPHFIAEGSISWIKKLPNGNFYIHFNQEPWESDIVLDFCSKMWENPFRWLFLGSLDENSIFLEIPLDIVFHILQVSHFICYVH